MSAMTQDNTFWNEYSSLQYNQEFSKRLERSLTYKNMLTEYKEEEYELMVRLLSFSTITYQSSTYYARINPVSFPVKSLPNIIWQDIHLTTKVDLI